MGLTADSILLCAIQQAQAEVTGAAGKAAAAAPPADAIAGALQKFGLRQPTRPVGVAKIDLASSFTQASASPASSSAAPASGTAATSRPQGALAGLLSGMFCMAEQQKHTAEQC